MITGKTLLAKGWPAGPVIGKALPNLELHVVDGQPKQRPLLLLVKRRNAAAKRRKEKFLCATTSVTGS